MNKKELAIELRVDKQLSLYEISEKLKISKSTASLWLREYPLKDKHSRVQNGRLKGTKLHSSKCKEKRKVWREAGRLLAKQNMPNHIAGCALYWAEGTKNKNRIGFTNADSNMILFFMNFLLQFFDVDKDELRICLNCYLEKESDQTLVEEYWLNLLGLNRRCLYKGAYKKCDKIGKFKFGICSISLCRTDVVQNIYGSIEEYFGKGLLPD